MRDGNDPKPDLGNASVGKETIVFFYILGFPQDFFNWRSIMKKKEVFNLSFSAIFLSFAVVIEVIFKVVPGFPNGGGVSLAMLPLAIISIVCGWKYGVVAGLAYGVIDCFCLDGYGFNPFSFVLDYVLAFASLGIVGVFREKILSGSKGYFILGLVLAGLLRWTFSGFSGVINANVWGYDSAFLEGIFGQGNGSTIWLYIYSFLYYNLPYISVSIALCIIVGLLLQKHIIKISEQEK